MSAEELLTRQSMIAGLSLFVSGLAVILLRRHLVAILLGFHLTILGAAVLLCRPGAHANGWTAAVLLAAAAVLAPMTLAAFARWRQVRGRATLTSLLEADDHVDG